MWRKKSVLRATVLRGPPGSLLQVPYALLHRLKEAVVAMSANAQERARDAEGVVARVGEGWPAAEPPGLGGAAPALADPLVHQVGDEGAGQHGHQSARYHGAGRESGETRIRREPTSADMTLWRPRPGGLT